jgi:hypothetical protein
MVKKKKHGKTKTYQNSKDKDMKRFTDIKGKSNSTSHQISGSSTVSQFSLYIYIFSPDFY